MLHSDHASLPSQRCSLCGQHSILIAAHLGICGPCIHEKKKAASDFCAKAHTQAKQYFDLPAFPPKTIDGIRCPLCVNACLIGEGEIGYCGLRTVRQGKLLHFAGTPQRGLLHWYRDPLPTNCVAMWACGAGKRYGYHNLAVFYGSCTMNCLFCQNWHYRDMLPSAAEISQSSDFDHTSVAPSLERRAISARELATVATQRTFCVCYFGGDPASQMPHALASAAHLVKQGVVICWETSGTANSRLMDRAVDYSFHTGGTVKFDLKAYDDDLHFALTGVSNRQTLENFARAADRFTERPEIPLVMASTLLVPGYVDAEEVARISRFIAGFNPDIPYSLLGFDPNFFMPDLPTPSVRHATEAFDAPRGWLEAGLYW